MNSPSDSADLGRRALSHLESIVRIDSQSDEGSETIPSTEGQRVLADFVAGFFAARGAEVTRDDNANVIGFFPGRGAGSAAPPLALMVHLDTARGTRAVERLHVVERWAGDTIPYPGNANLDVSTQTYPAVIPFVGHDVVHGSGEAPFGLDDKLGLTHLMSLVDLLAADDARPHPPLYLIGRPDEEVGRMEAVVALAAWLAERGVRSGYTVDGILAYEVNIENFNAAHASVRFPDAPLDSESPDPELAVPVTIHGVNTHGCTAKAEGSRSATRFTAEITARLAAAGVEATPVSFISDSVRDCDAVVTFGIASTDDISALRAACEAVISPHVARGGGFAVGDPAAIEGDVSAATADMLAFVGAFLASHPGFPLAAEDSEGRQGYSAPYRARQSEGGITLDIRLRDFEVTGLEARKRHVTAIVAEFAGAEAVIHDQYVNMGPRMADRRDLVDLAVRAGDAVGVTVRELPIRGGTGVDPFLDQGIAVANVGTGYFAPESEKELTSLQMMASHAKWLLALVEAAAAP